MATVIKGLLSHNLPWGLVITGMGISAVMELCGVSSLAFAVGAYLPLSTSTPIFVGGLVKWMVEKRKKSQPEDAELGPGALFSSGLIAGGALTGILIAILIGWTVKTPSGGIESVKDMVNTGFADSIGAYGDLIGLVAFLALAGILYYFGVAKNKGIVQPEKLK
jgi:uncharacterized oligopeptide transporter (OPT) family protein